MPSSETKRLPFYVYYFLSVSLYSFMLGFFPLHCKSLGFTPFEIALVSVTATAAIILGPPSILQFAHQLIAPRYLLLICSVVALLAFLVLFQAKALLLLIPFWFFCIFLKRGGDSLVDAQTLRDSAKGIIRFERVRMWGSIGFMVTTFLFGLLIDRSGLSVILPVGAGNLLLILFASFLISPLLSPAPGKGVAETPLSARKAPDASYQRTFLLLLTAWAFVSASHAVLYAYFSIYLKALDWSGSLISTAWNIGVAAEITLFLIFRRFEHWLSLTRIFQLSILITTIRWLILALARDPWIILCSQILHAFSFGGCYVSALKLVHVILPERLKDRGQGLLISLGVGLGALIGYFLAGIAASFIASYYHVNTLFLGSALFALVGLIISGRIPSIRQK